MPHNEAIQKFNNISDKLKDIYTDIGAGICFAQKAWDAQNGSYNLKKIKQYQYKTSIPNMISDALKESNYRQSYEWQYEREFISDNMKIEVIKYDIETSDWCVVKIDEVEKKISKKWLNQLYQNKKES